MLLSKKYQNDGKATISMTARQILAKESVLSKIAAGYYIEKKYNCICGNDNPNGMEIISEKDRYGLPVTICICKKCGMIMTNPTLDQNSFNRFYDEDYRNLYVPSDGPTEDFFNEQYAHGKRIAEYINKQLPLKSIKSVLEIGTGAGGIIKAIEDKIGANVTGIDLGSEYIQFGKEYGLELFQESAAEHAKRGRKYDCIILSHVLEHFLDIENETEQIKKLLDSDGIIYIELPGVKYTYKTYGSFLMSLQNAHVRYFTLDTLRQTLKKLGFECVAGNEIIQSIFRVDENCGSEMEINNFYNDNMTFLHSHEKKAIWYSSIRPSLVNIKHYIAHRS